jgi:hypothetical protein
MNLTRVQLVNPNCEVTDGDYNAIERAIMESSRGRWFLSEYARRNRHANTDLILSAINRMVENFGVDKGNHRPYRVSTAVSSTYVASQMGGPVTPLRPLQAFPKIVDAFKSNDCGMRESGPFGEETDLFNFKH